MIAAGTLNQRIDIEHRGLAQDGAGQPVEAWTLVAAVWASVRHVSGLETIKSSADVSTVRASIRIRYRQGLDAGMRVRHGDRIYNIAAVLPDAQRRFVDLVCENVS